MQFARKVADRLVDPEALSLEALCDQEALEIVARVLRVHALRVVILERKPANARECRGLSAS